MKILIAKNDSNAVRQANYRARHGKEYREKNATRMRRTRAAAIPEFVGVDSEGIGKGSHHRAVLLGVGSQQFVARDLDKGLQYAEVFEFLYSQFERKPHAAFVGFYLAYDFNQWLRSLPRSAAWLLMSKAGKAKRLMPKPDGPRQRMMYPVHLDNWDIDMLGFKRLSIRPRVCDCYEKASPCQHEQKAWMHICDAGPFYQQKFSTTCDPASWKDDPDGPICTQEEWDKLFAGKERRATARLDNEMMEYNALENELLARCMVRLAKGFVSIGIRLAKDQWYGPGAAAAKWLQKKGAIKHTNLSDFMPDYFETICRRSYFGGWFEIFSHGIIQGKSWNYDINSAYPHATSKLPHICGDSQYRRGEGAYTGNGSYVLLYGTVHAANARIGPVPYRDKTGSILRPAIAKGWYWKHELDAARRAGLIKRSFTDEWVEFIPCQHPAPYTDIRDLYNKRNSVGKRSALGLAIKNVINSVYGKHAQNTGSQPFNNWLYASLITAHCRVQILDAIATHTGKADSVLMVATDGVCFDSPHTGLPISAQLGEWEETPYLDLCLFKPGVYWHREGKEALLKVKSRGVPKQEFMEGINDVEGCFRGFLDYGIVPGGLIEQRNDDGFSTDIRVMWPFFYVPVNFRMKSCTQALNERKWNGAGEVQELVRLLQDSNPQNKRRNPRYNLGKRRIDTVIHDLSIFATETKYYGECKTPRTKDLGYGIDGSPRDGALEAAEILRTKPANYDLPLDDIEWVNVWGG